MGMAECVGVGDLGSVRCEWGEKEKVRVSLFLDKKAVNEYTFCN